MTDPFKHWRYRIAASARTARSFAGAPLYYAVQAAKDVNLPRGVGLNAGARKRWKHYFYGTTYLAAVFELLSGRRRTQREKYLFANLSALACFFDDLTDTFRPRDDAGARWQNNPEQYGRAADKSGLALHLLHNIYHALPPADLPAFQQILHRVFQLETAGRQHGGAARDLDELSRLTADKGGYSVLLFRRLMAHPLAAAEEQALWTFGALVQHCDDLFDIWFDRQNGIATPATVLTADNGLSALEHRFEEQVTATAAAFRLSGYPYRNTETALQAVYFLVGITRVCVQHYRYLQKKHGTLPLDDRRAMVVDMGRWPNRWRAVCQIWKAGG